MSFNDYLNKLVIEKEDILEDVLLEPVIIPSQEEATLSLLNILSNFFNYILNIFRKNKSK